MYSLTSTSASREAYEILRDENENENLSMLVTQKNVLDKKIIQTEGRLVQKADPVFNNPPADSFLRAHFFAPTKSIFGNRFDTYWVNFSVIWFMSLALLITLYFDAFKKLLDLFGKISISKMFTKAKK